MIKHPSSVAQSMTPFLIVPINRCPRLKTRASRWQYFCSSPWNRWYLCGVDYFDSQWQSQRFTHWLYSYMALSLPWSLGSHPSCPGHIHHWMAVVWNCNQEPFLSQQPYLFHNLLPKTKLRVIHCDCCHGRSCWWLQPLSSSTCWERGCRLNNSGASFLLTAWKVPVCSQSVLPYLWL